MRGTESPPDFRNSLSESQSEKEGVWEMSFGESEQRRAAGCLVSRAFACRLDHNSKNLDSTSLRV